jgi:hypothetical protein
MLTCYFQLRIVPSLPEQNVYEVSDYPHCNWAKVMKEDHRPLLGLIQNARSR